VVKQNNDGILYLFKKNKVSFFHGRGSSSRPPKAATIQVAGKAEETLTGKHIIVATGSNARCLGVAVRRSQHPPTTARCAWARCPRSWA
jgi:dihydrolipoamide dehydrogenase